MAAEIQIERNRPKGPENPLATKSVLKDVAQTMLPKQELVPLVEYMRDIAAKPRGTTGKGDLNSHTEEFIIRDPELEDKNGVRTASLEEVASSLSLFGVPFEILGVQSIGNANQKISAMVQGVDRNNPSSGYERPTAAEGPHMILAPFAFDGNGEIHLFRTIQMRTGEAEIDTPRGFADTQSLENGQQMYDVEGSADKVTANLGRILGEEAGNLQVKRIVYLGDPSVNRSFVTSHSAVFAVEVDYDAFVASRKVVSQEEIQRRQREFEREGIVGDVIDFTLPQYVDFKRNSSLSKDMAADFGTDTVVIDFMADKLTELSQREAALRRQLTAEGIANREFKQIDPEGYVQQRLRVSKAKHPEHALENELKAQKYLRKLYRRALDKAS